MVFPYPLSNGTTRDLQDLVKYESEDTEDHQPS